MHTAELVQHGISELTSAGVPECMSDVYLLLGFCLKKSRTQLIVASRDEVPELAENCFMQLLSRRKQREPLAYILGEQEFWSRNFRVTPAVLIPRPETEFLLERAIATYRKSVQPEGAIVDLCCGSGVIAIILALELKRHVVGIDLSSEALKVAHTNCATHGVVESVHLVQSDLLSALQPTGKVSLLVSNPPYVSTHSVNYEVEPEVRDHEPHMALDGGEKGLQIIEKIRNESAEILAPGGHIFMEIGYDQGQEVLNMFREQRRGLRDFQEVEILQDYAGRDRVLHAKIDESRY